MWCACSHSLHLTLAEQADGAVKSMVWKMSEQGRVSSESVLCVIGCEKSHQRDSEDTSSFSLSSFSPLPIIPRQPPYTWLPGPHLQSSDPSRASCEENSGAGKVGSEEEKVFGGGWGEQLTKLSWSCRESPPEARWEDMSVTECLCRHCKSAIIPEDSVTRGWGLHQFRLQSQAL